VIVNYIWKIELISKINIIVKNIGGKMQENTIRRRYGIPPTNKLVGILPKIL